MASVINLPIQKMNCAVDDEIALMCDDLGLKVQARRHRSKRSIEEDFKPMSELEIEIWNEFCPMLYEEKNWGEYKFDKIPSEVVKHISFLKKNYPFDEIQIRTCEKLADPLLIGIYGGSTYLLARWGLESPESLGLVEVYNILRRPERLVRNFWVGFLFSLECILLFLFYSDVAKLPMHPERFLWMAFLVSGMVVISGFLLSMVYDIKTRRELTNLGK